jgi:hypothetical protein
MFGLPVQKPKPRPSNRSPAASAHREQPRARVNPGLPRYLAQRASAIRSEADARRDRLPGAVVAGREAPPAPAQLSDQQLEALANASPIVVSGTAPGSAELESARRRGLIDVLAPKEFERQMKFQIARRDRYYTETWGEDDWVRYQEDPTDEVRAEIAEAKWDEYVNREYVSYLRSRAADWDEAARRMESAGRLGEVIGGVTAVFAAAFAIPIAAGPGSLLGAGTSFTGGEIGAEASLASEEVGAGTTLTGSNLASQAPNLTRLATAGGGAAAAPVLSEKIEEALPLVEEAAAALEEGFSVTGEGLVENAPRVANFLTETTRPYTGIMSYSPPSFQTAFSRVEEFVMQFEEEGNDLSRLRDMIVRLRQAGERVPVYSQATYQNQIVNTALDMLRNPSRFSLPGPAGISLKDIVPYWDVVAKHLDIAEYLGVW